MNGLRRQVWFRAALLVGIVYFAVGRLFALPATNVGAWRLAAWVVCGFAYGGHVAYEHFSLRNPPRRTAVHAAVAVAIGALALAIAGMVHSLSTEAGMRPAWLVALVAWPAVTAVPAFLGALVATAVLARACARR